MRRILLFIYSSLIYTFCVLASGLDNLSGAHIGYMITDLYTDKPLVSRNIDDNFIPASTLKTITTAVALNQLGSNYTFITTVYYTGQLSNDSITGSLIINPSGDPSLDNSFVKALSQQLSYISGNVDFVSPIYTYVSPKAMIEDIGTDYGVGWSPFNFNQNKSLINDSLISLSANLIVNDLTKHMNDDGISLGYSSAHIDMDTTFLLTHRSQTLTCLCKKMMHESDNLYARAIGYRLSPTLDTGAAIDSLSKFFSSFANPNNQFNIVDPDGLSRLNLLSPIAMSRFLKAMSHDNDFLSTFPTVSRHGTVKNLFKGTPLEGKLILKSGSMTGVLSYVGYKIGPDGQPTHSIVIFINNCASRHIVMKREVEHFLLNIFL